MELYSWRGLDMATKYQDEIDSVKEALQEDGASVTLIRKKSTVDDYTPGLDLVDPTPVNIVGFGLFANYSSPMFAEVTGTNIIEGDRKLLFSGPDVEVGDVYGSERVVSVNSIAPDDGDSILQICKLRCV